MRLRTALLTVLGLYFFIQIASGIYRWHLSQVTGIPMDFQPTVNCQMDARGCMALAQIEGRPAR